VDRRARRLVDAHQTGGLEALQHRASAGARDLGGRHPRGGGGHGGQHRGLSPAEPRGDRELVHATRAGETLAFDNLFYRYRDGIYRLGMAITKDPSAAEEIVVDTFARAHRAIERLEPDDSLRPWLYRVAVNLSYNRRPRKGVTFSSLDDSTDDIAAEETMWNSLVLDLRRSRKAFGGDVLLQDIMQVKIGEAIFWHVGHMFD